MPYITPDARDCLDSGGYPDNPGELNYLLTMVLLDYVNHHGHSYSVFNAMIGALECAKLELYRRMVAPYEEVKMEVNGDVYVNDA